MNEPTSTPRLTPDMARQTVCPHCARYLHEAGVVSRDHVLPHSMGGTRTVPTCKRCNEVLGEAVEARLLSRNGWFTLLSQAAGYTEGRADGTTALGQRAIFRVGDSAELTMLDPVHQLLADDGRTKLVGVVLPSHVPDDYLRSLAKVYGQGEVAIRRRSRQPPTWTNANLTIKIDDLRRLAAKIALCTGAAEWGDEFLKSGFGDWLRVVLDVWSDWPEHDRPAPLSSPLAGGRWPLTAEEVDSMTSQFKQRVEPILAKAAVASRESTAPPVPPLTAFLPADAGVRVRSNVLGIDLPELLVPHPLPEGVRPPVFIPHAVRAASATVPE